MNNLIEYNEIMFAKLYELCKTNKNLLDKLNFLSFFIFEQIPMTTIEDINKEYNDFYKTYLK